MFSSLSNPLSGHLASNNTRTITVSRIENKKEMCLPYFCHIFNSFFSRLDSTKKGLKKRKNAKSGGYWIYKMGDEQGDDVLTLLNLRSYTATNTHTHQVRLFSTYLYTK